MKHTRIFDRFLRAEVNLNQSRIDRMERHVTSIKQYLKTHLTFADVLSISPQGSWSHRTIIRPRHRNEFDADILVYLSPKSNHRPEDFLDDLYVTLRESGLYSKKLKRQTRCVTLDYSGDFHLDIIPCIVRQHWFWDDRYEICNRKSGKFERCDADGYKEWLSRKNSLTGNDQLIKVIRIAKYLRDTKRQFSCKSILLTTLFSQQVSELDTLTRAFKFSDVPTSFRTLFRRLDGSLSECDEMPEVTNPVNPQETFTRHWDEDKFKNFRGTIHSFRKRIDEAYSEQNPTKSRSLWANILGESFEQYSESK